MAIKKSDKKKKSWASSKRNMAKFEAAYRELRNPPKDDEE